MQKRHLALLPVRIVKVLMIHVPPLRRSGTRQPHPITCLLPSNPGTEEEYAPLPVDLRNTPGPGLAARARSRFFLVLEVTSSEPF